MTYKATKLGDSMDEPTKYRHEATKLGDPIDEPTKYRHEATQYASSEIPALL